MSSPGFQIFSFYNIMDDRREYFPTLGAATIRANVLVAEVEAFTCIDIEEGRTAPLNKQTLLALLNDEGGWVSKNRIAKTVRRGG